MNISRSCFRGAKVLFLSSILAVSLQYVEGEVREDYKCTFGNYPPSCVCVGGENGVPTDRCAAAVPPLGESFPLSPECGPYTGNNCEDSLGTANGCGRVWNCPEVECTDTISAVDRADCVEFTEQQKPACEGTYGNCVGPSW